MGGDLVAGQEAGDAQFGGAAGDEVLFGCVRYQDLGDAVVQGAHGGAHARVGDQCGGVRQDLGVGQVLVGLDVAGQGAQVGHGHAAAEGEDHVPGQVREGLGAVVEEPRVLVLLGAQGHDQDGVSAGRGLPRAAAVGG